MGACRRPSGFAQYRTLLGKDLRQEFRTKEMLVSMGIYALLVIVVYGVGLTFAHPGDEFLEVAGGLMWALVVFTSLLGLGRSFAAEKENGCIEGLLLAPLDRGVVFLAKATSNLVFLLVVEVIAVPLFWFFFSGFAHPADTAPLMAAPLVVGSIGIAGIGTLLSTITANARGNDVMLALLFVPIIFPLLYACVSATTGALIGGDVMADTFTVSLALAAGYDVIMVLLSWVLYDFVVS
ncbi:MAG: heme exporter protein CcmB [Eggerthellaceae bacterium]|nr:heme exporter protein CcmB [Eggerthellaceae bacterium]